MSHVLALALALLAGCATTPSQTPLVVPPAPQPPPVVVAPSVPGSKALRAVASMPSLISEPRIRVGLLTDEQSATFGRLPNGYYVIPERGGVFQIERGVTFRAPKSNAPPAFAVQVAALSDQKSATSLVERVHAQESVDADAVFDAATGLYRVLAGRLPTRADADALRARLVAGGWDAGMFVMRRPSDARFPRAVTMTDDEGAVHTFNVDSVLLVPSGGEPIEIGAKRYRGGARVFVNERGLLNVINEVGLEDYLRGVVPNEMGPRVYDKVEALKAQAIAARTYAVKRRGDYSREGYDICATPACQVYGGIENEHPLSDRAVAETAGLIATYKGEPIDALYTSTCGGETSDVSTMFPERHEPYLKAVRCVDLELARLDGRDDGEAIDETGLNAALFRAVAGIPAHASSWAASDVSAAVNVASRVAGFAMPAGLVPRSSRRRDVLTYLGKALAFDDAAAALLLPEDRAYFYEGNAPAAASFMMKYGILPAQFADRADLDRAIGRDELHAILYSWLLARKAVDEVRGKVASLDARTLGIEADGETRTIALPAGIPLFRQLADRYREYRSVPLMISDRATVVRDRAGRVAAAVFEANYDGAAFDRTSSYSSWIRSWRADELVESVSRRNPVTRIEDVRVLATDGSHRVKRLMVVADGGRTFTLEGIAIRWSLKVPDNLFVLSRSTDPDGTPRFTFFGKGWGHGTGMCQVGAYGMAFRGATAEEILRHYYTGIEIEKMRLP